jgi:hypothetical protein
VVGCGQVTSNVQDAAPPPVDSADLDAPAIDAPAANKKVFISSITLFPDFGGTAAADAICQNLANGAGLPGVFRAWLSVPGDGVLTRFTHATVPYVLVTGAVVANDFTELLGGTLRHVIDLTESGQPLADTGNQMCHGAPTCGQTFTGTLADGTPFPPTQQDNECRNWTSRIFDNGDGTLNTFVGGDSTMSGREWTARGAGFRCDFQARIYCFQQ